MVRSIRIKEVIFPGITVANGSIITSTYSTEVVNGEVLAIAMKGVTTAGSFFFFRSGTDIEISRKTDVASGTSNLMWYPRTEIASTTSGVALAGSNVWTNHVVNSPIYYLASGVSGGRVTGEITVFYQ